MRERKHITRSLRFTLTAVYTAVFTLLLLGVILLFRQQLKSNLNDQVRDELDNNFTVVKSLLRIDSDDGKSFHLKWHNDPEDKDETGLKARVERVFCVMDSQGQVLDQSETYESLGSESLGQVRKVLSSTDPYYIEKTDPQGTHYRIREFYIYDDYNHKHKFFVAVGTSLESNDNLLNKFTLLCVGLVPLVILTGCAMGWIFAGRALTPVLEIARTAQRISGSNLSLRIPSRKAGDELDDLIETFNQMIDRIEVNFNQIRQFSTDVSHELRTPITIIRGQLEVALFTAQTAEQYREAIVNSLSDIERLSAIVRALLLLSQAETGQVVLQKQPLDLVELAENITDQFQIPAEGADLKLAFHAHCDHCTGDFDRVQIERMLSNLLSNAIKFTPRAAALMSAWIASAKRQNSALPTQARDSARTSAAHLRSLLPRARSERTGIARERPWSGTKLCGVDRARPWWLRRRAQQAGRGHYVPYRAAAASIGGAAGCNGNAGRTGEARLSHGGALNC